MRDIAILAMEGSKSKLVYTITNSQPSVIAAPLQSTSRLLSPEPTICCGTLVVRLALGCISLAENGELAGKGLHYAFTTKVEIGTTSTNSNSVDNEDCFVNI